MTDPKPYALVDASDSLLAIIDVQGTFLNKLPPEEQNRVLNNICWLAKVAAWKGIPLVVTAEELDREPPVEALFQALPADTPIFNKMIFGLADQPNILEAVEHTGRRTAVLVGLETDVCIMHSALGLLERGFRVVVVTDATASPAPGHQLGLDRMRSAGVVLLSMKGLFYEWLRDVETVQRFHREQPDMREQAGIIL